MPGHGAGSGFKELSSSLVTLATVHKVNLGIPLWGPRRGVDVVTAKVLAILQGVWDGQVGKVLVSEGNNLALGDVVSQLIFARVAE